MYSKEIIGPLMTNAAAGLQDEIDDQGLDDLGFMVVCFPKSTDGTACYASNLHPMDCVPRLHDLIGAIERFSASEESAG